MTDTQQGVPPFDWPPDENLRIVPGGIEVPPAVPTPEASAEVPVEAPVVPAIGQREEPVVYPPTPFGADAITPHAVVGSYDCFAAEVTAVYDAAADKTLHQVQAIECVRADVHWNQTTGAPVAGLAVPLGFQPSQAVIRALPFPCSPDQPKYRVKARVPGVSVGDIVTILSGRDGRHYYLFDNEPFIGTVVEWATRYTGEFKNLDEQFNNGVGNWTIKVQRMSLDTDPDGAHFNWGDDRGANKGPDDAVTETTPHTALNIYYTRVWPLRQAGVHHNYAIGDPVLVFRRGRYFVCLPAPHQAWYGITAAAGPNSEAAPAVPFYWVQEKLLTTDYALAEGHYNGWTTSASTSGPRLVCAKDISWKAGATGLPVGTGVVVQQFQDPVSLEPYYLFASGRITGIFPVRCWRDGPAESPTDGDATTQCNRTYTVRTLEATGIATGGTLLGTDKLPTTRQATAFKGTMDCPIATGGGWTGLGYYNQNDAFVLWDSGERPYTTACPT